MDYILKSIKENFKIRSSPKTNGLDAFIKHIITLYSIK